MAQSVLCTHKYAECSALMACADLIIAALTAPQQICAALHRTARLSALRPARMSDFRVASRCGAAKIAARLSASTMDGYYNDPCLLAINLSMASTVNSCCTTPQSQHVHDLALYPA